MRTLRCMYPIAILMLAFTSSTMAEAQVEPETPTTPPSFHQDSWHASVSPYLWLAGMNGTIAVAGHEASVNQSFSDIFSNLRLGVMGLTEVRRGQVGILTDVMYVWLGNEKAIPVEGLPGALNLNNNLNTLTLTPEVAYRLFTGNRGAVDLLVGIRYYHIDAKIKATVSQIGQVSYSAADNWVDGIEGARFQVNLSRRVGAFLIGDAGGGGSRFSWQIATGIGYRLNNRWTSQFGYRRLYYQRRSGPNFGLDQTQQGLILGITYRLK